MTFELRPHQEVAVAKMHNGCILCGGVGVGKTHTAVQYYLNNEAPKPVYVITTAKKRDKGDWQDVWAQVGMHKDPELTLGAVVIVDSWENVAKYKEVTDAFFIFDEQRLVGTGAWVKAFYKISQANRWIMLSATPGDNWLDYVPVFRANGFIKNITQFKEEHVVQRWTGRYYQVTGYRQVPKLVRWRNALLVDMPYDKHTTRHTHEVAVEYDEELVRRLVKDRWHVYEDRPLTDASELFRVMRKVVYSDASRLTAIRSLMTIHPKLIVFYNFDYELEILRTLAHATPETTDLASSVKGSNVSTSTDPSSDKKDATPGEQQIQDRWGNTHSLTQTGIQEASPGTLASDGSREVRLKTSSTRSSKTGSGHESPTWSGSEQEMLQENPWEYLLSPQGTTEASTKTQKARVSGSSGTSTQTSPSTPGTTCDSTEIDTATLFEQTQRVLPQTSFGDSLDSGYHPVPLGDWPAPKTLRTNVPMDSDGQSSTSTKSRSPKDSDDWTYALRDLLTNTPEMTSPSYGVGTTSESSSRTNSSDTGSRPIQTGSSTRPPSQPKESSEWVQTRGSQRKNTNPSNSSSTPNDTNKYSDGTSSREDSLKTNTSGRSSTRSKQSPESSKTGSDSTSLPQFQVAEWNGHKHEEIPTTTSWVYLVQYVAGAEAWECVETDAIAFWSMPYSYKLWWQSHGRIDRLNTAYTDLHYYVLMSKAIIDKGVKKSLVAKKSFNESAFAEKLGIWSTS